MSERDLRRRIPLSRRSTRKPQRLTSPLHHRRTTPSSSRRRLSKQIRIVKRCSSEPNLFSGSIYISGDDDRYMTPPNGVLRRPQTYTDLFLSPERTLSRSPQALENYNKDTKVVVNVTVEGSPGSIRIMVKLGSSVEEIIKLVIRKYVEEGRTPRLEKDAASSFELHHSYFSLESLNGSDVIGDIGCRSFYLRKSKTDSSNNSNRRELPSKSVISDAVSLGPSIPPLHPPPVVIHQDAITRKINKIIRRTHKLWKLLGCMHCNG